MHEGTKAGLNHVDTDENTKDHSLGDKPLSHLPAHIHGI
jgi:hypothetical protein